MKKLKVLWFTNTPSLFTAFGMGDPIVEGSWISALESLIVEKETEIELYIAFLGNCSEIEIIQCKNVKYIRIPRAGKFSRWLRRIFVIPHTQKDIRNFLAVAEKVKPNLVHVFGTESAFGLISGEVNIPVLVQIQGIVNSFIPVYFGNLSLSKVIRGAGIRDLISGGVLFRYLNEKKRAKRELEILKKTKFITGRTDFDKSFAFEVNPQIKYFHLDDVIRREFFVESNEKVINNRLILQTVIHAEYYKGLDLIFETTIELEQLGIDFEWRIFGLVENDTMVRTIQKATGFKSDNTSIVFMGKVGADKLSKSMQNADIYIHTSFIENPSNAICEAMCLGLPVISANVGGTPSIVKNGVSGLLYKAGNGDELVNAILKLKNDPVFARTLGDNARISALQRHNPEFIRTELLIVYQKVIELFRINKMTE